MKTLILLLFVAGIAVPAFEFQSGPYVPSTCKRAPVKPAITNKNGILIKNNYWNYGDLFKKAENEGC